jgi:hypothetical protein
MVVRSVQGIETRSQGWAKGLGACLGGRRRLGRMSVAEYFLSKDAHVNDLQWIARRLKTANPELQEHYENKIVWARRHGRWATKRTREELLRLFGVYDVNFPARLL